MHKFSKQVVPIGQGPPANSSELIAKSYMLCNECGESLIDTSKRVYYCPISAAKAGGGDIQVAFENGDVLYWCLKCKNTTTHEHKLKQLKGTVGDPFKGMLKN